MKKVNEVLKEKRLKMGLTTMDIAQKTGIDVSKIEIYENSPGELKDEIYEIGKAICEALNISPNIMMFKWSIREGLSYNDSSLLWWKSASIVAEKLHEQGIKDVDALTKEQAYEYTQDKEILNLVELEDDEITNPGITFHNFKVGVGVDLRFRYRHDEWQKKNKEHLSQN